MVKGCKESTRAERITNVTSHQVSVLFGADATDDGGRLPFSDGEHSRAVGFWRLTALG